MQTLFARNIAAQPLEQVSSSHAIVLLDWNDSRHRRVARAVTGDQVTSSPAEPRRSAKQRTAKQRRKAVLLLLDWLRTAIVGTVK
jgi:hypothetical protein